MSPVKLVEAVLAAGGELVVNGDRIHYQIPEQAAALLDELRCHKPVVLNLLRQREQRKAFCHLLPFLGKRVWSPAGPGKLFDRQKGKLHVILVGCGIGTSGP